MNIKFQNKAKVFSGMSIFLAEIFILLAIVDSLDYLTMSLLFILSLIVPSLLVVVGLLLRLFVKKKNVLLFGIKGLAFQIGFALVCILFFEIQHEMTIRDGQGIVDALENFHRQNHLYPDSLSILVPIYLDQVPNTEFFYLRYRSFNYTKVNDSDYALRFFSPVSITWYSLEDQQWRWVDND